MWKQGQEYPEPNDYEQHSMPGQFSSRDDRASRYTQDPLLFENDRIKKENQKLQQKNAELARDLQRARFNIADSDQRTRDNKEHFLGDQALDDEVRAPFIKLMTNIRNWISDLQPATPESFESIRLDDWTKNELDLVVPGCLSPTAEYWSDRSGKKMRLLFRGWLAYVVSQEFLRVRTGYISDNNNATDTWLPRRVREAITLVEDELNNLGMSGLHNH